MTRSRKIITASIAALTIAGAVSATATPAAAWGHRHHGGWGWGGPAIAAGVIGGLTLGAMAAAAQPAYATCVQRTAVYDDWGRFRGYRRIRVAC
ncbi:MAG: hypothetical protein KF904_07085 [Rhodoblastus sp.]|nr:hypothetical protein [Rhodoblastus sp.]